MSITEADIHKIQNKIAPLLGKKPWEVSLGVGSFITFDFGAPVPLDKLPNETVGEWHLWITYCVWRLDEGNEIVVSSEEPRPEIREAIKRMEGLALCSVELVLPALETTLVFDKGVVLRLFPVYAKEYESWNLYMPDGNVLVIGPGASWSYESGSEPYIPA